jgi:hypothetical protein
MSLPTVPHDLPAQLQRFLQEMRSSVSRLEVSRVPPSPASNLTVTPIAGGNQITFTRSADATGYLLRISPTPSWDATTGWQRDLGDSNVSEDFTGQVGVTRYYWIVATKNDLVSQAVGPKSAASLAPGASTTLPAPPPSGFTIRKSDETRLPVSVEPHGQGQLR